MLDLIHILCRDPLVNDTTYRSIRTGNSAKRVGITPLNRDSVRRPGFHQRTLSNPDPGQQGQSRPLHRHHFCRTALVYGEVQRNRSQEIRVGPGTGSWAGRLLPVRELCATAPEPRLQDAGRCSFRALGADLVIGSSDVRLVILWS